MNIGRIYHYTSFENAVKILSNGTLYFSNPQKFNDPFDCNENLINTRLSRKGVTEFVERNFKELDNSKKEKLINHLIGEKKLSNKISTSLTHNKKKIGVSCFSKICDNILMWSHYANKHKGVCIGFDTPFSTNEFFLHPVNYLNKFEKKAYMDNPADTLLHWVLSKSHHWKYENEVRAVSHKNNGLLAFDLKNIGEVIFGCKIPYTHKKKLGQLIKIEPNLKNIDCFEMVIESESYNLKKKSVKFR